MHGSFSELVFEGSARIRKNFFFLDYHKFHEASIKRETRSRMASLRSQREKMVYEDALEPRGQKWDGDERRERERERRVRKGTNCLEIGVRSTS